ncbi:MAG TPA: cyclic 2,3-diphosphoglycerate synthase [Thermoplasmata archaeon]|nr:cyclic 2,3-diphosphoglycerate synthase [Thermoplasmata archaeon]HEV2429300.1 cyclic 2,3-diphosphoglycerate synthase [Thermoplasmata archaeon]
MAGMARQRVILLGAAGRDFHNFNRLYRDRPEFEVVAFTAAQIPDIAGRSYPPALSGPLYPNGIPIVPESELAELVRRDHVTLVVLSYSDLSHLDVMHKASVALAAGASFLLPGPAETMLRSSRPVVSIGAVRTGVGKSPVTRFVSQYLRQRGRRVAIVRHPMPYGDLAAQAVQRFADLSDLDRAHCTIEEREEYEPHLKAGMVVFAGVDYERILRAAESESDLVIWDGGNNDLPFFVSDLHLVLVDPHRAGHELSYHPGEANLRMADVVLVSKTDSARPEDIATVEANAASVNPSAPRLRGALRISADDPERLRGRRTLVVEDGPTVTHGGLDTGAGTLLAKAHGAEILDPHPFAVGSLRTVYDSYPHLHRILPAMGYSAAQITDLEATIRASGAEFVVDGSPVDLRRLVRGVPPIVPVRYEYDDLDGRLAHVLDRFLERLGKGTAGG